MKRKQITQIINTNWFPQLLKTLISEFLSWFVIKVNGASTFIPIINQQLENSENQNIINVEFNIGAGIETITPLLNKNIAIESIPISRFNTKNSGLYLFVNSFHQLPPKKAIEILREIAKSKNSVIILEGNNDSLLQIIGMIIFVPLTVILIAFFVKPFRITRIIFTYLIPILPIVILIDGCLALFKLYNPKDLKSLVSTIDIDNYNWKANKIPNGRGGKIMYLIGKNTNKDH